MFLTPTCVACRQLVTSLNDVAREHRDQVEVITVCHGSEVTCGEFATAYRLRTPMLLDATNAIAESYDVRMTPFGFLIGEDGIIRLRGVVNSWPQLEALLEEEGTVNPIPWQTVTAVAKGAVQGQSEELSARN